MKAHNCEMSIQLKVTDVHVRENSVRVTLYVTTERYILLNKSVDIKFLSI